MANTNGTLQSGKVVAQRAMAFLRARLPALSVFATDFSDSTAKFGEQIISRVPGVPTVKTFVPADGYVPADTSMVDVPVTISNHKYVSLTYGVDEISRTDRDLVAEQMEAHVYALAKGMVDAILALAVNANFTQTFGVDAVNYQRSTLVKAAKTLNVAKASKLNRFGLVNSEAFAGLSDDAKIISVDYSRPNNESGLDYEAGVLNNVAGFRQVIEYTDLPANAEDLNGIFGNADAFVIATRLPDDPALVYPQLAGGGQIYTVTDESGLTMLVREHYNWQKATMQLDLALMWGVAKGIVGNLVRVTEAA